MKAPLYTELNIQNTQVADFQDSLDKTFREREGERVFGPWLKSFMVFIKTHALHVYNIQKEPVANFLDTWI